MALNTTCAVKAKLEVLISFLLPHKSSPEIQIWASTPGFLSHRPSEITVGFKTFCKNLSRRPKVFCQGSSQCISSNKPRSSSSLTVLLARVDSLHRMPFCGVVESVTEDNWVSAACFGLVWFSVPFLISFKPTSTHQSKNKKKCGVILRLLYCTSFCVCGGGYVRVKWKLQELGSLLPPRGSRSHSDDKAAVALPAVLPALVLPALVQILSTWNR